MHPFVTANPDVVSGSPSAILGGASSSTSSGAGQIVLTRAVESPPPSALAYTDADALTLGGQFWSPDSLTKDADGNIITKIELDNVPVSKLM